MEYFINGLQWCMGCIHQLNMSDIDYSQSDPPIRSSGHSSPEHPYCWIVQGGADNRMLLHLHPTSPNMFVISPYVFLKHSESSD